MINRSSPPATASEREKNESGNAHSTVLTPSRGKPIAARYCSPDQMPLLQPSTQSCIPTPPSGHHPIPVTPATHGERRFLYRTPTDAEDEPLGDTRLSPSRCAADDDDGDERDNDDKSPSAPLPQTLSESSPLAAAFARNIDAMPSPLVAAAPTPSTDECTTVPGGGPAGVGNRTSRFFFGNWMAGVTHEPPGQGDGEGITTEAKRRRHETKPVFNARRSGDQAIAA